MGKSEFPWRKKEAPAEPVKSAPVEQVQEEDRVPGGRAEALAAVIKCLERGEMPWRRPWSQESAFALPRNGATGHVYSGVNRLNLLLAATEKGYDDCRWLTFNQAQALGGGVQKGERCTRVDRWAVTEFWKRKNLPIEILHEGKPVKVKAEEGQIVELADGRTVSPGNLLVKHKAHDGQVSVLTWAQAHKEFDKPYAITHAMFNVQQCRDLDMSALVQLPQPALGASVEVDARVTAVLAALERTGLTMRETDVHETARAYYSPGADRIVMPPVQSFESAQGYHSTLLHECVHATGHSSRLDRLQDRRVEDEYAREELVAEIGSAYLCAEVGVARDDEQHAAYIGAWLKQLKSKEGAHILAGAAKDAGKAADWLIERVPQREQEQVMRVHRERNGAEIGA